MCNQGGDGDDMKVVDLLECYQQSEQHHTVQKELNPLLDSLFGREQAGGTIRNKKKAITYATNFFWQVISWICSHFAYVSFCLHVSFCLQMCIISPTYGYDFGGLGGSRLTLIDSTG